MSNVNQALPSQKKKHKKLDVPQLIIIICLCLWALLIIYPFYNALLMSIVPYGVYVKEPFMLYPKGLDFSSYTFILHYPQMLTGFRTTLIVLVVGLTYNLFLTTTMAYGLSRNIPGSRWINLYIVFTMFFSGGMIPGFLLIKNLGLIDSYFSMILPTGISIFNLMVMRSYFKTIPDALGEAARIDGASELKILTRIYLPLSTPMLATVALFYAVDRWNEWYNGMLYIRSIDKQPLQLIVKNILGSVTAVTSSIPLEARPTVFPNGIQMAAVIVAMLPIAIVYPFLQKYFVAGLTIGGVKE